MRCFTRNSLIHTTLCVAFSLGSFGCGGGSSRSGTQTGDEGDTPESTVTTGSSSASAATTTSSGGASAASTTLDAVSGIGTNSGTTSGSVDAGSVDAGGAGGAGSVSSGGAENDSTTNTSAGGVAGAETGSDAPLTVSTSGGGTSGSDCSSDAECQFGVSCCDGFCVNLANDIDNCGACGVACEGDDPYCAGSACGEPPCDAQGCGGDTCCGSECCDDGELCCAVNQGPSILGCFPAVNGTCPVGCPDCDCAAPDTPVATPSGERAIASLSVGDLVYSVDEHGIVVVPIVQVNRVAVEAHHVMQVVLDDGTMLRISPRHPLFGGGVFGDLGKGSVLGERTVRSIEPVAYDSPFTHDVLPGSSSGAYFAGGALIGSTLMR